MKWLYLCILVVFLVVLSSGCEAKPSTVSAPTPTAGVTSTPQVPEAKTSPPPKPAVSTPAPKLAVTTPAPKPAPDYFAGKTIDIIVTSAAGGPTDMHGRAAAVFLSQYLPGNPRIIVRNVPGGGGAVALNSFAAKAKPDGMTLIASAASAINNQRIGLDIVRYDASKFRFIASLARAESLIFIRKDVLPRLKDPKAPAVIVGGREGTESWQAMPMWGKEFLGWNVRWIIGFAGSPELELAMRRGEIDMFGTADALVPQRLKDEGIVEIIAQIGSPAGEKWLPRSDYPDVPIFANLLIEKGVKGLPWEAYIGWLAPGSVLDRWLAAPPGTPDPIVSLLVDAYKAMSKDPKFDDMVKKTITPVYTLTHGEDALAIAKKILASSPETIEYPVQLQKKFGIVR